MKWLKPWHVPVRLATGAFILNSGLSKRLIGVDEAGGLHGFAVTAFPFLSNVDARSFAKLLSSAEIALGSALLVPLVPSWLADAGLTAFSGGLMRLYLKAPRLREEGSLRPTQQGIPIAKDLWMLGIGLALLIDAAEDMGT